MLVGKGQLLDLQIVRYAQEAVDINAEGDLPPKNWSKYNVSIGP